MIREINAHTRARIRRVSRNFFVLDKDLSLGYMHAQNRDLRNDSLDSDVDRNAEGKKDEGEKY